MMGKISWVLAEAWEVEGVWGSEGICVNKTQATCSQNISFSIQLKGRGGKNPQKTFLALH